MKPTSLSRDEVTTVRRTITLARHESVPEKLASGLTAIPGVFSVSLEHHKTRLWVTYDIRHLTYLQLCQSIRDAGGVLASGRWYRWQRHWYSFQNQNLRDNFNHQPACCSRPPNGVSSTSKGVRHEKQ